MLNNRSIKLLLCLLLLLGGYAVKAQTFKLPAYEKVKLPNGLTLYLMEQREVPLISISVKAPAGSIFATHKPGLASITADALLFGAGKRTKQQIEEELEFVGASLSSWADKETGNVQASFASKDAGLVLGILHDVLVKPHFNAEEWHKLQTRRLVELDQAKETPRAVIAEYYDAFTWGDGGYGSPAMGTKKSLQNITIEDIKQFYKQYDPALSSMAIVGDFKAADMKKQIQSLFKDWKRSGSVDIALAKAPEPGKARVLLVNKPDARETTFYIGGPGISRSNPDWVAIQVVNTILGGRFTSWLNDELRVNSGLTYGAGSSFKSYRQGGSFVISTFTKGESTEEAINLALKTYARLHAQGIDAQTLASAKNYVQGQFPPRYETSGALASLLTDMHWYGFNEGFINTFQQKVAQLDVAAANAIAQKYFPKENLQFVLIGKAEDLRKVAKQWGELSEKEIQADGF